MKGVIKKKTLLSNGTSRSGRARASASRVVDIDARQGMDLEIVDAEYSLSEFKRNLRTAKKNFDSTQKDYDNWSCEFTHRNEEQLITYSKMVSSPVKEYYKKMFSEGEGDNYRMRMCSLACKLFDPLFLKGKQDLLHTLFYCV